MKQRAEKHLEIALGGNMNIASLKPLALIEIMTDFAKKEVEAINYTRCCTELKAVDITGIEDITDPYWEEYIEGKKQ
jgi:maleate cis-trans isomerase